MAKMLSEEIEKQVRELFEDLKNPVKILFFEKDPEDCESCEPTGQLLEELVQLSDILTLDVYDIEENKGIAEQYQVDKTPGISIVGLDGDNFIDYGVRFFGMPAGHEFTSLIRNIMMVSNRDSGLNPETREYLSTLTEPLQLQVFITIACPYCPQAVILAHQFAIESDLVEAEMVDAMEFPELSAQYNVSGVPHVVINAGLDEFVGAMPEAFLLEKLQGLLS